MFEIYDPKILSVSHINVFFQIVKFKFRRLTDSRGCIYPHVDLVMSNICVEFHNIAITSYSFSLLLEPRVQSAGQLL